MALSSNTQKVEVALTVLTVNYIWHRTVNREHRKKTWLALQWLLPFVS